MVPRVCESCGQLLPPDNPFAGKPVKARIYDIVTKRPGLTRFELAALVYAEDPNGGPESTNAISIHIHWMNIKLAKLGLCISASRRRGGYRLLKLEESAETVPITAELIMEIKALYPRINSYRKVARQLGTSIGTVMRVMRGEISA